VGVLVRCCYRQWNRETGRFQLGTPEICWVPTGMFTQRAELANAYHRDIWKAADARAEVALDSCNLTQEQGIDNQLRLGGLAAINSQEAFRAFTLHEIPTEGEWSWEQVKTLWELILHEKNPGPRWMSEAQAYDYGIQPWGYWSAMSFLHTCARLGYGIMFL